MKYMFAKEAVIMNLCFLEKKVNLNGLLEISVKNGPKQSMWFRKDLSHIIYLK